MYYANYYHIGRANMDGTSSTILMQNQTRNRYPTGLAIDYTSKHNNLDATSENLPSNLCAKRRFRSICSYAQSDQNLHWAHFNVQGCKDSSYVQKDSEQTVRCAG